MNWDGLIAKKWLHSENLAPWQNEILTHMKAALPVDDSSLWILSSGTQSVNQVKAIKLTHRSILASAASVNRHLEVKRFERWLQAIPEYHVGGLGIYARAHLSGSEVFRLEKWSVEDFLSTVEKLQIALVSLVPTQVFDLVSAGARAPSSLRAIGVGGGNLDEALYLRARELGWPVLPSYGLTETAAQIACAPLSSLAQNFYPRLEILTHAKVKLRDGRILIQAESMTDSIAVGHLDGRVVCENPLLEGWLPTEDLGELQGNKLKIIGRRDEVVKVMGVLVPLNQVEHEAREFFLGLGGDIAVIAMAGGREENRLVLFTDALSSLKVWETRLAEFNATRMGPIRLKQICWVPKIPRGELGKVKKAELRSRLGYKEQPI